MKARIERERIPAGEDPQFHLKLGRGSLSDIEWTAQLLQLQHGVRAEGTMAALDALRGGRGARPRRRRRAGRRLPVLRADPQPLVPGAGRARATPCPAPARGSPPWPAAWAPHRAACGTPTGGAPAGPARWWSGSSTEANV